MERQQMQFLRFSHTKYLHNVKVCTYRNITWVGFSYTKILHNVKEDAEPTVKGICFSYTKKYIM